VPVTTIFDNKYNTMVPKNYSLHTAKKLYQNKSLLTETFETIMQHIPTLENHNIIKMIKCTTDMPVVSTSQFEKSMQLEEGNNFQTNWLTSKILRISKLCPMKEM